MNIAAPIALIGIAYMCMGSKVGMPMYGLYLWVSTIYTAVKYKRILHKNNLVHKYLGLLILFPMWNVAIRETLRILKERNERLRQPHKHNKG